MGSSPLSNQFFLSSRLQVAYCLVKQADAHWADHKYEDVLACYADAAAIFSASNKGADSAPILQLHSWCALACVALEDLEQALRWNQKAQELVDAICGPTSWERYRVLVDHARFLEFSVKQAPLAPWDSSGLREGPHSSSSHLPTTTIFGTPNLQTPRPRPLAGTRSPSQRARDAREGGRGRLPPRDKDFCQGAPSTPPVFGRRHCTPSLALAAASF